MSVDTSNTLIELDAKKSHSTDPITLLLQQQQQLIGMVKTQMEVNHTMVYKVLDMVSCLMSNASTGFNMANISNVSNMSNLPFSIPKTTSIPFIPSSESGLVTFLPPEVSHLSHPLSHPPSHPPSLPSSPSLNPLHPIVKQSRKRKVADEQIPKLPTLPKGSKINISTSSTPTTIPPSIANKKPKSDFEITCKENLIQLFLYGMSTRERKYWCLPVTFAVEEVEVEKAKKCVSLLIVYKSTFLLFLEALDSSLANEQLQVRYWEYINKLSILESFKKIIRLNQDETSANKACKMAQENWDKIKVRYEKTAMHLSPMLPCKQVWHTVKTKKVLKPEIAQGLAFVSLNSFLQMNRPAKDIKTPTDVERKAFVSRLTKLWKKKCIVGEKSNTVHCNKQVTWRRLHDEAVLDFPMLKRLQDKKENQHIGWGWTCQ
jgi:hypothetical protein